MMVTFIDNLGKPPFLHCMVLCTDAHGIVKRLSSPSVFYKIYVTIFHASFSRPILIFCALISQQLYLEKIDQEHQYLMSMLSLLNLHDN